jgi:hypothetical protein
MPKKYRVELDAGERRHLEGIAHKGRALARKRVHAPILLKADEGPAGPAWSDERIAEALEVSVRTIERVRQRLVEHGLEDALVRRLPEQPPRTKLDGAGEAKLIAVACSPAPEGRRRWTIRLLADKLVELNVVDSIGREAVRMALKKTSLSLG